MLLILILPNVLFAETANYKGPYKVLFYGKEKFLDRNKTAATLETLLNVNFCRGTFIPTPTSEDWNCFTRVKFPGFIKCERSFECQRGDLFENRIDVIKQTRQDLKKYRNIYDRQFKVIFPKLDKNKLENKYLKIIDPVPFIKDQKKEPERKIEKTSAHLNEETKEEEDIDYGQKELTQFLASEGLTLDDIHFEEDIDILLSRESASDDLVMSEFDSYKDEDVKWSLSKNESFDKKTKTFVIRDINSPEEDFWSKFNFFKTSASITQVSSDQNSSLFTYELSWNPSFNISDDWNLKSTLGGHLLSYDDGNGTESFLVYDLALSAQYFTRIFYYELGFGKQFWRSNNSLSATTIHYGIGYSFKAPILRIINQMFINYVQVLNNDNNTELKFGLGFQI